MQTLVSDAWIQISAWLLTGCLALGKSFDLRASVSSSVKSEQKQYLSPRVVVGTIGTLHKKC